MWRGFNLKNIQFSESSTLLQVGRSICSRHRIQMQRTLREFTGKDGVIDVSSLRDHWFEYIPAEVFISHSHQDEKLALGFAGWLNQNFGLRPFVDSAVWGFMDDLLREVDNKYCLNPDGATYNYDRRNQSTSHVHMMLASAIAKMIDATECVIFLNTPQSIETSEIVSTSTYSPWISWELSLTKIIRARPPERIAELTENYSAEEKTASARFRWPADLSNLAKLDADLLGDWREKYSSFATSNPLDILYQMTG